MATITSPTLGSHFTQGVTAAAALTIASPTAEPISEKARWQFQLVNAETGTLNSGSDLALVALADDGKTIIGTAWTLNRTTAGAGGGTSAANALTAIGNNRATALLLSSSVTHLTTAAAGTGVALPLSSPGMIFVVFNDGASPIKVYAAGTDTIDGVAGATGVTLTNAKRCGYWCVAPGVWLSAQLGVISA